MRADGSITVIRHGAPAPAHVPTTGSSWIQRTLKADHPGLVHLRVELRTPAVSTAGRHLRKQVLVGETYPWFQPGPITISSIATDR